MTNKQLENTSQDYDRKNDQYHVSKNPRASKDPSAVNKNEIKQYPKEDKREVAREEPRISPIGVIASKVIRTL